MGVSILVTALAVSLCGEAMLGAPRTKGPVVKPTPAPLPMPSNRPIGTVVGLGSGPVKPPSQAPAPCVPRLTQQQLNAAANAEIQRMLSNYVSAGSGRAELLMALAGQLGDASQATAALNQLTAQINSQCNGPRPGNYNVLTTGARKASRR
jgi:hypothetical protein